MASITFGMSRNLLFRRIRFLLVRHASEDAAEASAGEGKKGLVVGLYTDPETKEGKLTGVGQKINAMIGNKMDDLLKEGKGLRLGKATLFENLDGEFNTVAVVGLGPEGVGYNELENLDENKENTRIASGAGVRRLQTQGVEHVYVEKLGCPEAAAEGAALASWRYQENKNKEHQEPIPTLHVYSAEDKDSWQRGIFKAEAQNLARRLSDTPANLMTPAIFAQNAVDALCPCGVTVEIRNRDWIESKRMHALLAVARGSCEPPVFLELGYCGGPQEEKPIVLVGKGITFDSGGLCLKPCKGMDEFRADMAGAAVIVAVMRAAAALSLPLNIQGVLPLCENLSSGMSMRPGDVVATMNGKTIRIDNTDNEGRLMLADAMIYAQGTFKPKLLIDVATLTGEMRSAIGCAASGVFTNSHDMWKKLNKAGSVTGDRVWRFPLWDHFRGKITSIESADLTNVGEGPGAGPCRAAAFLREFVTCVDWIHMDIASAGMLSFEKCFAYMTPGRMTGRPTRTLVHFLYLLACTKSDK
ncbi:cytosol aminopeptidase-like [Anabrus simplex]|uniref:cytosol aminopeptidase-like n=1 Tax=Anabrus simplex TaxID=316456 RepID=UPI0034DD9AF6